jgi:hypothetical protein
VIGVHLYSACGFVEVARQIHYAMPLGSGDAKLDSPDPELDWCTFRPIGPI